MVETIRKAQYSSDNQEGRGRGRAKYLPRHAEKRTGRCRFLGVRCRGRSPSPRQGLAPPPWSEYRSGCPAIHQAARGGREAVHGPPLRSPQRDSYDRRPWGSTPSFGSRASDSFECQIFGVTSTAAMNTAASTMRTIARATTGKSSVREVPGCAAATGGTTTVATDRARVATASVNERGQLWNFPSWVVLSLATPLRRTGP